MLKQARSPVKRDRITIRRIDLICANVLDIQFPVEFNFIYSIGVFGEHAPWDVRTCNRLFDSLKPGGKLFFTVVDVFSRYPYMSKKRRIAEKVNLMLPSSLKRKLRERLGTFYVTDRELTDIFKRSKFGKFDIIRQISTAQLWKGAHYECLAAK
jgi:SAM-dependent methyltransferase